MKLEGFDQGHVDRLELILACRAADLTFLQTRAPTSSGEDEPLEVADNRP